MWRSVKASRHTYPHKYQVRGTAINMQDRAEQREGESFHFLTPHLSNPTVSCSMVPVCSVTSHTDLLLCGSSPSSLQGADSRDSQMSQALQLLENEHQELQTKLESLQGDGEQQSSETQDLQGTPLLWGHRVIRTTTEWAQRKEAMGRSFAPHLCLVPWFHFSLRERQRNVNQPKWTLVVLHLRTLHALSSSLSLWAIPQLLPY